MSNTISAPVIGVSKKRLVLHIGLQKTGTSSIQVMLASSSEYLRQEGYYFPKLPEKEGRVWNSPFRHNILVSTYADFSSSFEKLDPAQEKAFWSELRQSDLVPILSAEEFSRLGRLDNLASRLSDFDVHLIAFLRRQDLLAESLYNQRNKILLSRNDKDLLTPDLLDEESLFRFLKNQNYIRLLNYDRLLAGFSSDCSPRRTTVRAFERSQLTHGDACLEFANILGVDGSKIRRPEAEANGSIGNNILKRIIDVLISSGESAALEEMTSVSRDILSGKDCSGDYRILSPRTRKAMLGQYDAINKKVAEAFDVSFRSDDEIRPKKLQSPRDIEKGGMRCTYKAAIDRMRGSKTSNWSPKNGGSGSPDDAFNRIHVGLADVRSPKGFKVSKKSKFFCVGSCFAREVEDAIEDLGFEALTKTNAIAMIESDLDLFSRAPGVMGRPHAFLNRYNSGSMRDLMKSVVSGTADESLFYENGSNLYHDYALSRFLSPLPFEKAVERRSKVMEMYYRSALEADVFVFTLGLCESFYDQDGQRFLNVTPDPRTAAGHSINFRFLNYIDNLNLISELSETVMKIRPEATFVYTVSPVPLDSTFTGSDIIVANTRAKSTLVAAAQDSCDEMANSYYFPSYEMVTLSDPTLAWLWDRKHVSPKMVSHIMDRFIERHCE